MLLTRSVLVVSVLVNKLSITTGDKNEIVEFPCISPDVIVSELVFNELVFNKRVCRDPPAFCTTVEGIDSVVKAGPPVMLWATVKELTEILGV